MDRGAWRATVHGSQRVGHDWSDLTCMPVVNSPGPSPVFTCPGLWHGHVRRVMWAREALVGSWPGAAVLYGGQLLRCTLWCCQIFKAFLRSKEGRHLDFYAKFLECLWLIANFKSNVQDFIYLFIFCPFPGLLGGRLFLLPEAWVSLKEQWRKMHLDLHLGSATYELCRP